MQDFSHALQCPPRSLKTLQSLITRGKYGKQAGKLKPLDKLLVADLRVELNARDINFSNKKKPEMQELLTEELKGAQRVPSLLVLNPTQPLEDLNLKEYEVLDCEPLHDLKGHLYNLLQEVPHLVSPAHKQIITQIIESTIKETSSGVHLRVAAIKVYLKLCKLNDVDKHVKLLLGTVVKISQLLYLPESGRNSKTVLQLYNLTWLHHELCCQLIPNPKTQTREKLYGTYLHDLTVHAPMQYQMVCLRSTNAEGTERLFSQIKHIATNRKPDNVLTTILLSLQAKEETGTSTTISSIHKQGLMVTDVARNVPPYSGTLISKSLKVRMSSWQAHLTRISAYLKAGEEVWWKTQDDSYQFFDSDNDPPTQPQGPTLNHFRNTNIDHIQSQNLADWKSIVETNVHLPTPFIKTYEGGEYTGRRYYSNEQEATAPSRNENLPQPSVDPLAPTNPNGSLFLDTSTSESSQPKDTIAEVPTSPTHATSTLAPTTPHAQTGSHIPVSLMEEFNSCESDSPITSTIEDQATVDCELKFSRRAEKRHISL